MNGKFKDFLGKPAPAGYVAGLGRGASGFVTRPDIGPARAEITIEEGDEEQFDENEVGLLGEKSRNSLGINDPEDLEADRIYAEIDEKMAERRKSRREKQEEIDEKKQEILRPKTQLIFSDLKRDLSRVSESEWATLPEVGDFRVKRLKKSGAIENSKERFLPVPIDHLMNRTTTSGLVQETDETLEEADFIKIGEARGKLLGMHLDQISRVTTSTSSSTATDTDTDSASTSTPITNQIVNSVASDEKLSEIGDLKRARQLFASIIKTNRKNASGWISAARLEFQAGNQKQARALITRGCEECSKSEEIWKEAIKMHQGTGAREILAKALKSVPDSVDLWLMAVDREPEISVRKKILRAALERNSSSPQLWMALVELEESETDAQLLLTRAVECAPEAVNLWIALARLQESTPQARQVLNRARLACPKSFTVWINAARLEEANDTPPTEIKKLLARGAAELSVHGIKMSLTDWQNEAEECERGGDLVCAGELISIGIDLALSVDDTTEIKDTILKYARATEHVTCAKSALKSLLNRDEQCKEAFLLLLSIVKRNEEALVDELKEIYENAIIALGKTTPELWINYARDFKEESGSILSRAVELLLDQESRIKIWREAISLEINNLKRDPSGVDEFLSRIPDISDLLIEKIHVYEVLGLQSRVLEICQKGCEEFPKEPKFWLVLANYSTEDEASILKRGLEACPWSVSLALRAVELENDVNAGQILLEKTRLAVQKSKIKVEGYEQLLAGLCLLHCPETISNLFPRGLNPYTLQCNYLSLKTEKNTTNSKLNSLQNVQTAKLLLNQFLKECPKSGVLWHLSVSLEPRQLRRSKVTEALRRFEINKRTELEGKGKGKDYEEERKGEALLRWTLATLMDDKNVRDRELAIAASLDPTNFDLKAYFKLIQEDTNTDTNPDINMDDTDEFVDNLDLTDGVNWKRFVEKEKLYFLPIKESFEMFINSRLSQKRN